MSQPANFSLFRLKSSRGRRNTRPAAVIMLIIIVKTNKLPEARENKRDQFAVGFRFASDWFRTSYEFSGPINQVHADNVYPWLTFGVLLYRAEIFLLVLCCDVCREPNARFCKSTDVRRFCAKFMVGTGSLIYYVVLVVQGIQPAFKEKHSNCQLHNFKGWVVRLNRQPSCQTAFIIILLSIKLPVPDSSFSTLHLYIVLIPFSQQVCFKIPSLSQPRQKNFSRSWHINLINFIQRQLNKGGKFLKKLWSCVGVRVQQVIQCQQLS